MNYKIRIFNLISWMFVFSDFCQIQRVAGIHWFEFHESVDMWIPDIQQLVCVTHLCCLAASRIGMELIFSRLCWPTSTRLKTSSIPILLAVSQHKHMTYTSCCKYIIIPPDDEQWAWSKHIEVMYQIKLKENSASLESHPNPLIAPILAPPNKRRLQRRWTLDKNP
jgi:hypothetical protein